MPTITTLIPAYKPDYLADVFLGLRRQTCRDFRVLLSDDSPDAAISRLIREGHFGTLLEGLDLRVVRGPQNARLNHQRLLDDWGGATPLAHLHLDDDVIYPDFYRAHLAAHAQGGITLSVSRRWLAAGDGRPAQEAPLPPALREGNERVVRLASADLCPAILPTNTNWLGELSNMVVSAAARHHYPRPPTRRLNYYGLLDLGFALEASRHAPIAFIHDHLGAFRQHAAQTTHNVHSHGGRIMFLAWVPYALVAWAHGHLDARQAAQAIETATRRIVEQFGDTDPTLNEYLSLLEHHQGGLDALHQRFSAYWQRLLAAQPGTDPARYATVATEAAVAA
jgi:hypothetical protein